MFRFIPFILLASMNLFAQSTWVGADLFMTGLGGEIVNRNFKSLGSNTKDNPAKTAFSFRLSSAQRLTARTTIHLFISKEHFAYDKKYETIGDRIDGYSLMPSVSYSLRENGAFKPFASLGLGLYRLVYTNDVDTPFGTEHRKSDPKLFIGLMPSVGSTIAVHNKLNLVISVEYLLLGKKTFLLKNSSGQENSVNTNNARIAMGFQYGFL